jgi:nucleoside-diphosphate-sugar epimerase
MKVLVTGSRGYIGSHLCQLLKDQHYDFAGVDIGLFPECEISPVPKWFTRSADFRNLSIHDLKGFDVIIHLAAISNDPMGEISPLMTKSVNFIGTQTLAEKAKRAGISLFLFSSSCSVYGKTEGWVDERSLAMPLTEYASSKLLSEIYLKSLADYSFKVICLRSATAYGHSPMFRSDLVANDFMISAVNKGKITVNTDGSPLRPLVHCRDIARAFLYVMNQPHPKSNFEIFNFGKDNFSVKEIAEKVSMLSMARMEFLNRHPDSRSYRVKFDKWMMHYPGFQFTDFAEGLKEMKKELEKLNDRFIRVRMLQKHALALLK